MQPALRDRLVLIAVAAAAAAAVEARALAQPGVPQDVKSFIDTMVTPTEYDDPQPLTERQRAMREELQNNPGRYAPEIRRRLLALLPERINDEDELASLGNPDSLGGPDGAASEFWTLSQLTELLGREHAEPILRRVFERSSTLIRKAQPIFDRLEARQRQGEKRSRRYLWAHNAMDFLWSGRGHPVRAAKALGSPIFVDDCLTIAVRIRQRPEDWFLAGFAELASDYMGQFAEQRPQIYARLAPLADEDEMIKIGDAAYNLAYNIKTDVRKMRERLEKAGKLPREP